MVEYALILVLVAIVVIGILLFLGPTVGRVYCQVTNSLQPGSCGAITGVSASRSGNDHGNDVVITITVSTSTSVTVSDSQSGATGGTTCANSCSITLTSVGNNAGTITVTAAEGGSLAAGYSAKL